MSLLYLLQTLHLHMRVQIPLTNPYFGPRSCIVVDNCSIHHVEEIRQLVEDDARKFFSIALLLNALMIE